MPDQDARSFINSLCRVGRVLYWVVLVALCPVSYITTFQGFQTIFQWWPSAAAAAGLQAAMIAAWIFWSHNRAPARRLPWLCAGLFTCALSIGFSFVGLRSFYMADVLKRERPIRDRQDFQQQRGHLQEAAAAQRGAALAQLDGMIVNRESRRGLAELNQNARKIRAGEYRKAVRDLNRQIRSLDAGLTPEQRNEESSRIRQQIRANEGLITVAEATGDSLGLDMMQQKVALEPLRKLRGDIQSYAPGFRDAKDDNGTGHPDWDGLRREYARFIELMQEVPGGQDFKGALQKATPAPPGPKLLSDSGEVFDGEGHPIKEAFSRLLRLEPADTFLFAIAASFDVIPLLFTWAFREKMRTVPEAVTAMGTWMRRTRLGLESMEGIIPFVWNFFWTMLFSRPTRTGHDSVLAFEEFISREQLTMDATLQNLVLPDALRELISLEMSYLHTRSITIASERAAQFERLAWNAYERCLAAVRNATGIDEETRAELMRYLSRQLQRFTATVSDYGSEEEILGETSTDNEQEENPQTGQHNHDPQPAPGDQQQHRAAPETTTEAETTTKS